MPDFPGLRDRENVKKSARGRRGRRTQYFACRPSGSGKIHARKAFADDFARYEQCRAKRLRYHSVVGMTSRENPIVTQRPFRAPHHTLSSSAMAGGAQLQPGEISLAHNGVLFWTRCPSSAMCWRSCANRLDGKVTISRSTGNATYPAGFMLMCDESLQMRLVRSPFGTLPLFRQPCA